MKRFGWYLALLLVILMACKSSPPTEEPTPEDDFTVEEPGTGISGPTAGHVTVSQEMYDTTLVEVKRFVDNLNSLISNKNYDAWKQFLSDEYFARISSPDFLARTSESNQLKSRNIILKTPVDYFLQVVVPARSNSRVDEIEFTETNRVKVYFREERVRRGDNNTTTTEIRRLRLYELIRKAGDTWKIID
jgi:hypothetical protein